jgi:uncharacterized protein involved in exopolysaccharide biosynthesis
MPVIEDDPVAIAAAPSELGSHVTKLRLLWDGRRFLLRLVAFGLAFSAAIVFLIPKRYESTVRLMPPDSGPDGMAMLAAIADKAGGLGSLASGLLGGGKSSSDILVGILNSNTLRDRLIARYDLKQVYRLSYQEDLRERLGDNTSISVERKSGILTLTVTDRDPQRAQKMANSYVEELNTLSAQLTTSAAHRERVFLDERLREVTRDLEEAEKELSQFSSKNATLNPQEQGKAMVEAAANLQGRLIAAQAQLEGMRSIYTDGSVRVKALKAEIASLEDELQRLGGKAGLQADPTAPNQLYPSIRQLPLLSVTWADLYRRAKVEEAVFEVLTKQDELARVQEAKEIPSVKSLDRGELPQKKSFPPRTLLTALGGFFAFCFGAVWILAMARWEAIDPQHPGKVLTLEIWDTLTSSAKKMLPRRGLWRRSDQVVIRPEDLHENGKDRE